MSVNLEAGGGDTPIKVALTGEFGAGQDTAFANLDSFIDYHANDMLVMLAGEGAGKLKHNFKGMIQARRQMPDAQCGQPQPAIDQTANPAECIGPGR